MPASRTLPHPVPDRSSPRPSTSPVVSRLRRARRAVLLRRRPLAVVLTVVAVLAAVRATAAPVVPTTPVVVAARDLPGGTPLVAGDLAVRAIRDDDVASGSTVSPADLLGRTLASPLRRGEPVTDVRVVADGLLAGYPARVALPVRIADAGAVGLLRVGDRVDVVATDPATGRAEVATSAAPVVALPRGGPDGDDTSVSAGDPTLSGGALVVLAVPRGTAVALAGRATTQVLSVLLSE